MNRPQIRVLLVEDNEDDYELFSSLLREVPGVDFEIEWVDNLNDAIRAVHRCVHDVALADYYLGEGTALDLLRGVGDGCTLPIILLTGSENREADVLATQAGAADYLVKQSITSALLERAIRYALERKRVEAAWRNALAENNRLSVGIANLPVGMIITDATQRDHPIVFTNPAFTAITGYSSIEVNGRNCRFMQGEGTDPETRRQIRDAIAARQPYRGVILNYRKDGTPFWNELTLNPIIEYGELTHYVGLTNDVTQLKQAQESLLQAHAELEQRVSQRTEELARANHDLQIEIAERRHAEAVASEARQEAERANGAKNDFLTRMSHQMRTPLNSILGFGQLLQMGEIKPRQREQADLIVSAGHQLLALTNEVLDIACVEAGQVTLAIEPTSVNVAIAEALAELQPLATENNLRIIRECDACSPPSQSAAPEIFVLADPQRFRQVLLHLLSNAMMFNEPGGYVRIRCEEVTQEVSPEVAAEGEGGKNLLRVAVANSGRGIAPDKIELVFTPFERLDAPGDTEGTGLGLALSKLLVEAMGGAIEGRSTPDGETAFSFTTPLAPAAMVEALQSKAATAPPARDMRVLYIEDNLANLALIERVFDQQAMQLMTAQSGREGLELACEHLPGLILLDVHLPDIRGDEVLRSLQDDARTRDIPVVVLSADATSEQIERLTSLGASAYLTKPLDIKEFLDVVNSVAAGSVA